MMRVESSHLRIFSSFFGRNKSFMFCALCLGDLNRLFAWVKIISNDACERPEIKIVKDGKSQFTFLITQFPSWHRILSRAHISMFQCSHKSHAYTLPWFHDCTSAKCFFRIPVWDQTCVWVRAILSHCLKHSNKR